MTRRYARKLARRSGWRREPEPVTDTLAICVGLMLAAVAVLVWGMP